MSLNFGIWLIICITLILLKCKIQAGKHLLGRVFKYLSTVVASAKKKIDSKRGKQTQTAVKKLEICSEKMMKWSEELSTADYEYWDTDTKADKKISKASKSTQTDDLSVQSSSSRFNSNNRLPSRGSPQASYGESVIKLDGKAIRQIQDRQCDLLLTQIRFLNVKDVKTPLLICVEATSTSIAGYCINLNEMTCKFYIYSTSHLPWNLETCQTAWDTTEFKMKNLVFALLLWKQEIIYMKKFSIYSNCWAINNADNEYGKAANEMLEHFTACENVIRVNSNPQVSRYRDTEAFARLIQPASELVFWNLTRFRKFIKRTYGINNFEGTHMFLDDYSEAAKDHGYFARSYRYRSFLNNVDKNIKLWFKRCPSCGFNFRQSYEIANDKLGTLDPLISDVVPYPLHDCW